MADDTTRDEDVTDVLPEDLNAAEYVGPYVFPNNNRRRVPGYLYLALGAACIACWAIAGPDAVLVNGGFLAAGVLLVLLGAYHLVAGWNLDVDERDALVAATRQVGFAVGHASAQLGWRGLRSRPTWKILLYSAEEPPLTRGLVLVDGVDGEIVAHFVEDNPEDWSDLPATDRRATDPDRGLRRERRQGRPRTSRRVASAALRSASAESTASQTTSSGPTSASWPATRTRRCHSSAETCSIRAASRSASWASSAMASSTAGAAGCVPDPLRRVADGRVEHGVVVHQGLLRGPAEQRQRAGGVQARGRARSARRCPAGGRGRRRTRPRRGRRTPPASADRASAGRRPRRSAVGSPRSVGVVDVAPDPVDEVAGKHVVVVVRDR